MKMQPKQDYTFQEIITLLGMRLLDQTELDAIIRDYEEGDWFAKRRVNYQLKKKLDELRNRRSQGPSQLLRTPFQKGPDQGPGGPSFGLWGSFSSSSSGGIW